MLEEKGIEFHYREYRKEPLDREEISSILFRLGKSARDLLRRRDRAFRELELTGDEPEEELIAHMAAHPTLLERPIGIKGLKVAVGRPPENLLALVD